MGIENIMYFALGVLAAGLLALIVVPAIWRRAVRLTKARIEAATPMTLAEFRADKDQLRAEFALSTRRLEKNLEALRVRLADQLSDINAKTAELAQIKAEHDQQSTVNQELRTREKALRDQILALEKTGTDLAQKLRMRDRDYDSVRAELEAQRAGTLNADRTSLIESMQDELKVERQRAASFEAEAKSLTERLKGAEAHSAEAMAATAELRRALAAAETDRAASGADLTEAEARIADAESRLNTLLEQTQATVAGQEDHTNRLLAEKLSFEEELEGLRRKISGVEAGVIKDWQSERFEQSHLRQELGDIASEVSRIVYAIDEDAADPNGESLFERVRKYAGDSLDVETLAPALQPEPPADEPFTAQSRAAARQNLSRRMAALRNGGASR